MNKLSKLKVLIYGIKRGPGIEISKNIFLTGTERVNIFDNDKMTIEELGSNFLFRKDIGFCRDEISLKKLKELNNIKIDYLI